MIRWGTLLSESTHPCEWALQRCHPWALAGLVCSWLGQGNTKTFVTLRGSEAASLNEWILIVYLLSLVDNMLLAWNCRSSKKTVSKYQIQYWNEKHVSSLCGLKLHVSRTLMCLPVTTKQTWLSVICILSGFWAHFRQYFQPPPCRLLHSLGGNTFREDKSSISHSLKSLFIL